MEAIVEYNLPRELSILSDAKRQIQLATTIDEICEIRDKAQALRMYAKQIGESLETKNALAEITLRAEWRAGEMLSSMDKQNGARGIGKKVDCHDGSPLLSDLGITHKQSTRWQQIHWMTEDQLNEHVESVKANGGELTQKGALKAAKQIRNGSTTPTIDIVSGVSSELGEIIASGNKFGTIYADPPWKYGNQETRAATDNHYPTMSVADIAAMEVGKLAADDAHLHLWTTNAFLFESREIMEAWGFTYKSCFVWVKPQMGIGNYWRLSHEFLLLGIRGKPEFRDRSLMSWGQFDRTKHSAKPPQVRAMIEKASPGPYLELFGRQEVDGWFVFGNQVKRKDRSLFDSDAA